MVYFASLVLIKRPKKVYFFNSYSLLSFFLFKPFYSCKIIYHNFDYNPYVNSTSQKFFTFIEKYLAKYFEFLIFSNDGRGKLFKKLAKIKKLKIFTIFNCLPKKNKKRNLNNYPKNKILFRIGSIGPQHSLKNLVISMKYLSGDFKLLLCGKITDYNYYKEILNLIRLNKLQKRIKIKTFAKKVYWEKKIKQAAMGIALYENPKNNISHKYMCGASQKINSYLSENLPILMSNEKQYVEFNKKYKCCINVNIKNPKNIAKSIKKIFSNRKKFIKLKNNSYKAFIHEFNFEKQIKKISNYL